MDRYKAGELPDQAEYGRDISDIEKDDIIWRKKEIKKIFEEDPDLLDYLGQNELLQHQDGESEEESRAIDDFNERLKQPEIIPWLKINPTITNVQNTVMFDIYTERLNYDNPNFLHQYLIIMIMVREEMMDYNDLSRVDVIAYIIKDLLYRTNSLGLALTLSMDEPKIIEGGFYCRELRFTISQPNQISGQLNYANKYDKRYQ